MANFDYRPSGRLVPVLSADEKFPANQLALSLAKSAAAQGETVLMLDLVGGELMQHAGIVTGVTLGDVLYRKANIKDAKYISHNEHFTAAVAGDATLDALLGSLAALSLNYDWTIVCAEHGCTPAHVNLAGAADAALLGFGSQGDQFMRAYWMIDAIRARAPKFDPLMIASGPEEQSFESYELLRGTIREFLGAPPALGAIIETAADAGRISPVLLECIRQDRPMHQRAVS